MRPLNSPLLVGDERTGICTNSPAASDVVDGMVALYGPGDVPSTETESIDIARGPVFLKSMYNRLVVPARISPNSSVFGEQVTIGMRSALTHKAVNPAAQSRMT